MCLDGADGVEPQQEGLVYLDGIVLKRSWTGEVRNVLLLMAMW